MQIHGLLSNAGVQCILEQIDFQRIDMVFPFTLASGGKRDWIYRTESQQKGAKCTQS